MRAGKVTTRQPLIALLLSICPGLGQQYAGKLARGVLAYTGLIIVSWLAAIAYMYVNSRTVSFLLLSVPFFGVAGIAIDAMLCAKHQPEQYQLKWFNRIWIYALVFIGLLVTVNPLMDLLVGGKVVRAFFVTSGSMAPAIIEHDLLVINKLKNPRRGDIVLISFADTNTSKAVTKILRNQILRRVIAQAGDTLHIEGREVYINGVLLEEPYAFFGKAQSRSEFISTDYRLDAKTVPDDSYFVMSDSREFGFDSRMFGFIQKEGIKGVATKVFWSWNHEADEFKWSRTAIDL